MNSGEKAPAYAPPEKSKMKPIPDPPTTPLKLLGNPYGNKDDV